MDKYEFNIKVEQIRKLVNKGDYETAMKIADTVDWKRVRNANLLSMIAQIYEKNAEYQEAKDILLLAFERAPIGKRLLFKLTELALKEDNVAEAEAYYREFCDLAGDDPRQHLLRYMILKAKGAPAEQLIHSLERYTSEELDEKWLYELAELYHQAGDADKCVATCDQIMLMFGLGKYVDKAMELKIQYAPLTNYQMDLVENRDKYEAKLKAVKQEYESGVPMEDYASEDQTQMSDDDMEDEEPEEEMSETAAIEEDPEPVVTSYPKVDPELEADVKQAETEEYLAKELSRMDISAVKQAGQSDADKTIVLGDIRRAQEEQKLALEVQHTTVLPNLNVEEEDDEEETELSKPLNHLMIEARTPEKGLAIAMETLKQIQKETGIKNPVAKITGEKLNKKGILAMEEKLAGKDLIIEDAADLTPEMIAELETLMTRDTTGMRIVLVDNPKQMEKLHKENPSLASRFECIGQDAVTAADTTVTETAADGRPVRSVTPVREKMDIPVRKRETQAKQPESAKKPVQEPAQEAEMDIDDFAQYACQYASEIDCSITGKSMLALYERIEIMEEDGIALTRDNAEALIEEAADRAEKPSFGKRLKNAFVSKYDKDGLLILREEHFI